MNKIVSASEFKAKCLQLIDQMQKDGQPVTITKRGKVVAELGPKQEERAPLASSFGIFRSDRYRFDMEPEEPACDPDDWEALRGSCSIRTSWSGISRASSSWAKRPET